MKNGPIIVILTLFMLISIIGCEKKEAIQQLNKPVDMETKIRQTSGKYLSIDSPLKIVLYDNEYATGQEDEEVTGLNIDLKPKVRGKAVWQDNTTIHFIPDKNFKADQSYQVSVYPSGTSPEDPFLTPLLFSFTAVGRRVRDINLNIYIDEQDEDQIWVQGMVEFTIPADTTQLISGTRLEHSGRKLELNWEMVNRQQFQFRSEKLEPDKKTTDVIEFLIDADALELDRDVRREINLLNYNNFQVRSIKSDNEDDFPTIELTFSETLQRNQDFNSLLYITPTVETEIILNEELLRISGNFQAGEQYNLICRPELRSITGKKLNEELTYQVSFSDKKPLLQFSDDGVFLTGDKSVNIYFRTINLTKVDYSITRIFDNNLGQFLHYNNLKMHTGRNGFNDLHFVGKQVADGLLEIGEKRNQWLQHELNISSLLPENEPGFFVVELTTRKEYSLYRSDPNKADNFRRWDDPSENYYYYNTCTVKKPVVISDLGLTCKKETGKIRSFVTDLQTTKPVWGAEIKVYSMQNQIIGSGSTGLDGSCLIEHDENPFYVTAGHKGQQSLVKLNSDRWETSSFDTKGVIAAGKELRSYVYTERGVYRPGDLMNIMIVMRNSDDSFPDGHPVDIKVIDPLQAEVFSSILKNGKNGVYHLPLQTNPEDPTGNWLLTIGVGKKQFHHYLKIETVAPERLKLTFNPQDDYIKPDLETFDIELETTYLFGRAAAGLQASFRYNTRFMNMQFQQPQWQDFSFTDVSIREPTIFSKSKKQILDENGKTVFTWEVPQDIKVPSAAILSLLTTVTDKGGRGSSDRFQIYWNPYEAYTGIKTSSQYLQKNQENELEIVLLDIDGNPVSGEELVLKIYENNHYWWWEYNSREKYLLHFKSMPSTRLLEEHKLISSLEPIRYLLPDIAAENILIEVTHNTIDGEKHRCSKYLHSRSWSNAAARSSASIMELTSDKKEYKTGEIAHIYFPASSSARNLVTLEKSDQILDWWWFESQTDNEKAHFELPLTEDMTPGVYVTVSVIQPHTETANDCPLRMYGIIPVTVINPDTKEELSLETPETIAPNSRFTCRLTAKPDSETQFTIAVVDEGLLSLTDFKSPDPWKYFYSKERLQVVTSDLFDKVAGVTKGFINNRFAVGGGIMGSIQSSALRAGDGRRQIEKNIVKRFYPVSLFSGVLNADASGKAEVEFEMPDYLGSVRFMAVSINGSRYGCAEKSVTVRKELMLLPTLPRALAPEDTFLIPVEVFSFEDKIRQAEVTLKAEGPLIFLDGNRKTVVISDRGEGIVYFKAAVKNELKPVKVIAQIISGKFSHISETNIPVRPLQPYSIETRIVNIQPGDSQIMNIEPDGLPGTEKCTLNLIRNGYFDYNRHLKYLVNYPYGCLEQKISAAFPQLFLTSLVDPRISIQITGDIDRNINAAINQIGRHQKSDGSFLYWQGGRKSNLWANIYAAHFLLEASLRGYHVPVSIKSYMFRYLRDFDFAGEDYEISGNYKTAVYRLYVLARAGSPKINTMNYLMQNHLEKLDNVERWLLAAAYEEAGQHDMALEIIKYSGWDVPLHNNEHRHNFSSVNRDRSIILALATLMNYDLEAENLYYQLADELNSDSWFSTQTRAFMLWALSLYVGKHPEVISSENITGSIINSSDEDYSFDIADNDWLIELDSCRDLKMELTGNSAPARFRLVYDRVPDHTVPAKTNDFFSLSRYLKDENGKNISTSELKQGNTYQLQLKVQRTRQTNLENMALTQILPSGWEVVNDRLENNSSAPRNDAQHTDIRDDRILWSFSAQKNDNNTRFFSVRIRAVTAGSFDIPPAILEAMYSPDYTVILPGGNTVIEP